MRPSLAVVGAAVVAVLIGACDSDRETAAEPGPSPWDRSNREPVPASAQSFEIDVFVGGCVGAEEEVVLSRQVDHLDVEESAGAVTITAWTRPADAVERDSNHICADVGASTPATVTLDEPLGQRQLREGFCEVEEVKDRMPTGDPEGRCSEEMRVIQPSG